MSSISDRDVPRNRSGFSCKLFGYFLKRSFKETRHRLCYYLISLGSCFLAIYVALIANTIVDRAPLIFLKIGEIVYGEMDVVLTPATSFTYYRLFNLAKIDALIGPSLGILAPRFKFYGAIGDSKVYYEPEFILIDSERERKSNIGSKYDLPTLKEGECAIHSSISDKIEVHVGQTVSISVYTSGYTKLLYKLYDPDGYGTDTVMTFCKVAYILDDFGGKVPYIKNDDTVIMEFGSFLKHLSKHAENLDAGFKRFLGTFNPYHAVGTLIANHPDRYEVYANSNYDKVLRDISSYSSDIVGKLGFFPVSTSLKIIELLGLLDMGLLFLSIILNLIVIILAVISTFLIYSLLTISVETRTFEFGIMRMLGTNKFGLAVLVLVQAMLFVLPAFVLALLLSYPGLMLASNLLKGRFGLSFSAWPTPIALVWALALGIFVPLFAAALPIKQVVSRNLVESLDVMRSKSQGVHISVEYASKRSSWSIFGFGAVTIVYGLGIYYFLPYSLLSMNLQLMLWILLSILIAIIVGLIMLSLNITHLMEQLLVYVFLFYESAAMKFLVIKNMVAHKMRNRKTVIIYALSLGFLMLSIVAYKTELHNIQLQRQSEFASRLDLHWWAPTSDFETVIRVERILRGSSKEVEDFAWTAQMINSVKRGQFKETWVTDYGRQVYSYLTTFAFSPNYFNVANQDFLDEYAVNETSGLLLSEQLYTARGSQGIGIGAFAESSFGVNVNDPKSTFLLYFEKDRTTLLFDSRPIFMLNSCPGLVMSYLTYMGLLVQAGSTSLPLYMKLTDTVSFSTIKWHSLAIKIKGWNKDYLDKVYKELTMSRIKDTYVWNYDKETGNFDDISSILDIVFIIIIIFFMLLNFFSLSASMTANILEQTKEIAIIRSIGFTKARTVFMHVYEAFVLVLTGSTIGALIGMLIAYTLCMQRILYSTIPMQFEFPYVHLIVMIVSSIACAVLSTVSPSLYMLKKPISELART